MHIYDAGMLCVVYQALLCFTMHVAMMEVGAGRGERGLEEENTFSPLLPITSSDMTEVCSLIDYSCSFHDQLLLKAYTA